VREAEGTTQVRPTFYHIETKTVTPNQRPGTQPTSRYADVDYSRRKLKKTKAGGRGYAYPAPSLDTRVPLRNEGTGHRPRATNLFPTPNAVG